MLGLAAGDFGSDPALAELAAVLVVVVAAVGADPVGTTARTADPSRNGRNRVDERDQLGDVVAVAAGERPGERYPGRVDQEVVLGASSASVHRARARFRARGVHKLDPPANQHTRRRDRVNAPHALHRWIDDEFAELAVADQSVPGRVRLYVRGGAATIGWNTASGWLLVWVKKLLDGERELLRADLSEPGSLKQNKADFSFRVRNEADLRVLRELIRRHIAAQPG